MAARTPRVFMGLIEVAGYYTRLASGLRSAGVEATFVDLSFHQFAYSSANPWWLVRAMRAARAHANGWTRVPARALFWMGKLALFVWAAARCDVFIFSYATTFFWLRELPLLRRLGKRIIFVFHGGDCRPPYLDGLDVRAMPTTDALVALAAERKRRVRYIETYADAIVAPLTCAQFFEKPVISFLSVGIPVGPGPVKESQPAHERNDAVRVLHSPSNPVAKGTPAIRSAIESLRRRGHRIDYVEITGRSHEDVARELDACDIVVDQAYSDTPMPTLASEAAWRAKPTVIGGYAWQETARFTNPQGNPPTLQCEPDELTAAIERLIVDPALRASYGQAAHAFVAHHWRADRVAERFVRIMESAPEPSWLVDPRTLRYVWGAGMSRELVAKTIAAVLERHGPQALLLDDKPELRREAIEAAQRLDFEPARADVAITART
jgi:hypothetical protein